MALPETNVWFFAALGAVLMEAAVGQWAEVLTRRSLRRPRPAELRAQYDDERWARSRAYAAERSRLASVEGAVDLAVLLGFWLAGGFGALQRAVLGLGLGPVPTGLVYLGALLLARRALGLPFRWHSTFSIEERYGFNRTTRAVFFADLAKGLALGAVVGGAIFAGLAAVYEHLARGAGSGAWLAAWAGLAAFVVLLQFVAPAWIFPLFNRFTPLPEGELRTAILSYAARVGFPLRDVYVIDGSRRSTKANAFFTGFGRNKRIALYDTLIERHSVPELVAVLAHEIGHYRLGHVLRGLVLSILHMGPLMWLFFRCLEEPALFAAFGVEGRPLHVGLVLFGLLVTPAELLLGLALGALSRRHEYQADRFAARTTGAPEHMASALLRLSADSLANPTPHPLCVALYHTHPPVLERVAALRAQA